MGSGLAQVVALLMLTVVGLPLFFFALLAALDRFERSLSDAPQRADTATDASDATVLTLPVIQAPTTATASKPAAAV